MTFQCEFSKTFSLVSHIHGSVIQKLYWFKSKIKQLQQKFFPESSKRQIFKYLKYKNFVEIITMFWTGLRCFRASVSTLQLIIIRNLIYLYHFGINAEYDLLLGQKRTFHSGKIPVCNLSLLVISTRDCREAKLAWNDSHTPTMTLKSCITGLTEGILPVILSSLSVGQPWRPYAWNFRLR